MWIQEDPGVLPNLPKMHPDHHYRQGVTHMRMKLWLFIIVRRRPYSIVPRTLSCYAVNHSLEACEGFVAPVSWILVRQTVEMRCTNFSVGSPGQSLGSETSTIYQGATPADCSTVVRKSSRIIGKEIYISSHTRVSQLLALWLTMTMTVKTRQLYKK